MEYLVDRYHKGTTKIIGKRCSLLKCNKRIVEGDLVHTTTPWQSLS